MMKACLSPDFRPILHQVSIIEAINLLILPPEQGLITLNAIPRAVTSFQQCLKGPGVFQHMPNEDSNIENPQATMDKINPI
jgi:hypothetical protein